MDLDEPSPAVRAEVQDLVSGASVGYCMTKAISGAAQGRLGMNLAAGATRWLVPGGELHAGFQVTGAAAFC